jgi:ATP-dependent helicase IRC3
VTIETLAPPRPLALRAYQQDALAAIEAAEARGVRRQLIALPTGTGKTIIFVHLLQQRGGRALILVHRDELLQQVSEKLALVGLRDVGIVKAEHDQHDRPVVVASVQTLSRDTRLARVTADFETIIVDEAHHATADSYRKVLAHVGAFAPDGPLVTGWTATAERADGTALGDVFQEIVFEKPLLEMIRAQYLCDVKAVQVHLAVDFNSLHTRAGDFIETESERLLLAADAPAHVVEAYQAHAADRTRTIVFTPTITVAHAMADAFTDAGIAAEALDASTPLDQRRAILRRFHAGETAVIPNCGILTEGFDCPPTDCIIVARPTKSRPLYVQMVGRGTRRYPGKSDCLILDVVGVTARHDLVTAATLFGVEPAGGIERSVLDAVDAAHLAATQQAEAGRLIAQTVDLFRARPLNWVAVAAGRFALAIGEGGTLLLVAAPDGQWTVRQLTRDRREVPLRIGLDLGFAQGWAEDHARQLGAGTLLDRRAAWRQGPASEKQLDTLYRCRVPVPPGLTKGDAADLLTKTFARSRP